MLLAVLVSVSYLLAGPTVDANFANDIFRGVNIGGWLVLESWIVPSIFNNSGVPMEVGEWNFCEQLGRDRATQVLTQHWDTWLTYNDVETLASVGVTHVRIPIGYWIVDRKDNEPFADGGWAYLERGIRWFSSRGIQSVLDLHCAPGQQNPNDNGGRTGAGVNWAESDNIQRTVDVLSEVARRAVILQDQGLLIAGIELLNEPWTTMVGGPLQLSTVQAFYVDAYKAIRYQNFQAAIFVHDGFAYLDDSWRNFMGPPQFQDVYIDTHIYHAFGGARQSPTPWANVWYTCNSDLPMINSAIWTDWTIVGEWSLAIADTKDDSTDDDALLSWRRSFFTAQMDVYTNRGNPSGPAKGQFFWNFKTETGYENWNFILGVKNGWIPSDLTSLASYEFTCGDYAYSSEKREERWL